MEVLGDRLHYSALLSITAGLILLDVFMYYLQCVCLRVEKKKLLLFSKHPFIHTF